MSTNVCPTWAKGASGSHEVSKSSESAEAAPAPWSGAALGTAGLGFLTARSEPNLVAVIGPHNAGKTTLLGMFYQQLGRTGHIGAKAFAGSYTLEGWEAIAHALRWEGSTPKFPQHTTSGGGRVPGILHIAMRDGSRTLSDVLFADSPGEWFQRWSVTSSAPDAEGARWVLERATTLIVVADCEALSGDDRGSARNDLVQLIRRVANERRARPAALVWTKADLPVPQPIRNAVTEAALRTMPDIVQFRTSVLPIEVDGVKLQPGVAASELLEWAATLPGRGIDIPDLRPAGGDPFFMIGAQ